MMDLRPQGWQVELQCPQCGGPVVLEETDRIFSCSFCRVRLFIFHPGFPRYFITPRSTELKDVFFLPYWRFKGFSFSYENDEIQERVVDSNLLALKAKGLPVSLGFRPQVLKLRFAASETRGRFLKPHFAFKSLPSKAGVQAGFASERRLELAGTYEAFVGETLSLIYSPTTVKKGVLFDSILDRPIGRAEEAVLDKLPSDDPASHAIQFLPTLCPHCGWDLQGEKNTLVLICKNCDSAWVSTKEGLKSQEFAFLPGEESDSTVYLPFWQLRAEISGVELSSCADLIRMANLARAVTSEMGEQEMHFRIPAFKVQPMLFLRLSKFMTIGSICDKAEETRSEWPKSDKSNLHPVTLDANEAAESIPVTMESFAVPKRVFVSKLHEIKVKVVKRLLVYTPFIARGNELIHPKMPVSISANALKFGRFL